jgi:hypothetical protein
MSGIAWRSEEEIKLVIVLSMALLGAGCISMASSISAGQYAGGTGLLQQMDQKRYYPNDAKRADVWMGCLQQTAGKGRERFDLCMEDWGYTR